MGPVLSVRDLRIDLSLPGRERRILDGISFDVAPREIVGVVGASGAGKTVLSRAVVNWIAPPLVIGGGEVRFRDRNLLTLPAREMRRLRRDIAYVGANPMGALDPTLPVGRQIVEKIRAVAPEVNAAEAQDRVIAMLDAVRIPSASARFHDYPSQFSGGMMQRALIVDAMISNPALLVADNVTQPLDVTVAAQVIRLMRELTEGSTPRSCSSRPRSPSPARRRAASSSSMRAGWWRSSRPKRLSPRPAIPIPANSWRRSLRSGARGRRCRPSRGRP